MIDRGQIYKKYNGRCAYSGTILEDDWQVDHLIAKFHTGLDNIDNLVPCQKLINHYKRSLTLEEFRVWRLGNLHTVLKKLPRNPRTEKSKKHIKYMTKIAEYFNIKTDKPFSGKFYFEITGADK